MPALDNTAYEELIWANARRLAEKHKKDHLELITELAVMADKENLEPVHFHRLEQIKFDICLAQLSPNYREETDGHGQTYDEGLYEAIKEYLRVIYDKKIYPPHGSH